MIVAPANEPAAAAAAAAFFALPGMTVSGGRAAADLAVRLLLRPEQAVLGPLVRGMPVVVAYTAAQQPEPVAVVVVQVQPGMVVV